MHGKTQMLFQAQAALRICALKWITPGGTGKKKTKKNITTYVWPKGGREYIQFNMSFSYNEKVANPLLLHPATISGCSDLTAASIMKTVSASAFVMLQEGIR